MPVIDPPWIVEANHSTWLFLAAREVTNGQDLGMVWESEDPGFGQVEHLYLLTFRVGAVTEAPTVAVQDPRDRLRSHVSEDLGSLMDAVEAIPVDAGVDIAFTNAVSLEPGVLTTFREATRATDSATVDLMYYPRPRQNSVMEEQFDGVTILSRLAAWYPPRMYGTVTELGIPNSGGLSTAQQVITGVLTHWATLQPWLTFKAVPDLRMPTGAAPSGYGPTDGLVTVETVTLEQDREAGRIMTALDILRDLLSPFPGAVIRQDSEGDLVIIATSGPDADESPHVTLRTFDVYAVSTGKPDPFTTFNRATFTSVGGRTRSENVPVMQPAWFQVGSNYRLGNSAGWFDPPEPRVNLQPPRDGDDVLQESLTSGQFHLQRPNVWPVASDAIPAGSGVGLVDLSVDPTISTMWRVFGPGGGFSHDGAGSITMLTFSVPFSGVWVDAFRLTFDIYHLVIRARWSGAGIELGFGDAKMEGNCTAGCWSAIVEVTLNDSSVGYAEAGTTTVEFGNVGDSLPSADGGNAVADSQAAFGLREAVVNVRGYALDAATLTAAARGFVLHNITPKITREVELSLGAQGVVFDAVGRMIELPNGERGVLTGLSYSDEFTTGSWSRSARVQVRDVLAPGALPDDPFGAVFQATNGDVWTVTSEGVSDSIPINLTSSGG